MKTIEPLEQEFKRLPENFEKMKDAVLSKEGLVKMMAKHALYEIEPFYFEHWNEYMEEGEVLVVFSEDDFNPKTDDLYTHWVDVGDRKIHFRRWHIGKTTYYDTVFEYHDDYVKSATVFFSSEEIKPIKLAYMEYKNGMPYHYIEAVEGGTVHKEYRVEDQELAGYFMYSGSKDVDYKEDVKFEYDPNGSGLNRIVLIDPKNDTERLISQRPKKGQNMEDVLAQLEENLVEEITQQIQEKVRIEEEKVYCVLLQHCVQGPFPPAVAIGLESEYDEECLLGAADLRYFSEDGTLPLDLYTPEIEEAEVFVRQKRDMMKLSEEEYEAWEEELKAFYLRVCKRIFHMNFSKSFTKTDHFIVYANDIDAWNAEEYIAEMRAYTAEKG
ncbi:hypothetical protein OOZ15_18565 [Galbibacter sp. EGI 63066]|uniref:hypothetical protein n=1 Tax=Galbibacter sp. EGI 63066 TaxID=2993559 RepID=UPI0022494D1A|nr:hypothetical protein [Galbibacter sp. EGI 63066]MCX2681961.1 hypothetical protein [Galbibacter sp. EGI 63066]